MSFKSEFSNSNGWSIVDTNRKTNSVKGHLFRQFLKNSGVHTVIRYYASSQRGKTISRSEAKVLSNDGFNILPVYQDNARRLSDFGGANGEKAAENAERFANEIGQPIGTTILFAVDTDFSQSQINEAIVPFFKAIQTKIGNRFRIGAYGSGAVLQSLLNDGLITVSWISMSRLFTGTKEFFFNGDWTLRQVPPEQYHQKSGFGFDRNVLRWDIEKLGAFRLDATGVGRPLDVTGGEPIVVDLSNTEPTDISLIVSTEGLHFRDRPNGNKLSALTIGTKVQDLGPSEKIGWRNIKVNGQIGSVFGKYLREPKSVEIEALVAAAIAEWVRFDKGKGDEKVEPFRGFVGEMWQSIGLNYDGASVYENGQEVPWSAAFISFVVRKSGPAYANFLFSPLHSEFAHDAIQARVLGDVSKPFWGFKRSEVRAEVGDIVHRNRGKGKFSFEFAETHSQFSSHSDIVVEVHDDIIRVMGGNVDDTVSTEIGNDEKLIQEYNLDEDGLIQPGQKVISILKNRAAEIVV